MKISANRYWPSKPAEIAIQPENKLQHVIVLGTCLISLRKSIEIIFVVFEILYVICAW